MSLSSNHGNEIIEKELKSSHHPVTGKFLLEEGAHTNVTWVFDNNQYKIIVESSDKYLKEMAAFCQSLEQNLKEKLDHPVTVLLTSHKAAKEQTPPQKGPTPIPNVNKVIAIASGKGGVGKSTTTLGLALSLSQMGYKVGVLDADIYGPSLPRMLGITEKPDVTVDKKLIPILKNDLVCLSIGFMIPEEAPTIWRGPMVQSALKQLIHDVAWDHYGPLDVLFVDLPPGTGDIHLTLVQQVPLTGAVIVSTPQDIALIDAVKGLRMFERVEIPVLGMIENMSTFICPHCHEETAIFSSQGVEKKAAALDTPLLGKIPLQLSIRQSADAGAWSAESLTYYESIAKKLSREIK